MVYCKEFNELFNSSDITLLKNLVVSIDELERMIKQQDCATILPWLETIYKNYLKDKTYHRPFHLGLGNPDANILIVGHELAINVNRLDPVLLKTTGCSIDNYYSKLFVNEAILNYYLWWCRVKGISIQPNCCIQDPEFASSYCFLFNREKPWHGHYWANISIAIGSFLGRLPQNISNERTLFETKNFNQSFLNSVFLTELNHIPSPKSSRDPDKLSIQSKLNDLATISFFKKFKRIVFACHTYIKNDLEIIKRNYNAKSIQSNLSRNVKHVYENNWQRIIICNNLSGAAAWQNKELEKLGKLFN